MALEEFTTEEKIKINQIAIDELEKKLGAKEAECIIALPQAIQGLYELIDILKTQDPERMLAGLYRHCYLQTLSGSHDLLVPVSVGTMINITYIVRPKINPY